MSLKTSRSLGRPNTLGDSETLAVRIPTAIGDRIRAGALEQGTTVSEAVREALMEELSEFLREHDGGVRPRVTGQGRTPLPGGAIRGRVYFIQAGADGPVKIGFTRGTAEQRRANLQTGSPRPLVVLAEFEGDQSLEASFHVALATWRELGEWYAAAPALALLKSLRAFMRSQERMAAAKEAQDAEVG